MSPFKGYQTKGKSGNVQMGTHSDYGLCIYKVKENKDLVKEPLFLKSKKIIETGLYGSEIYEHDEEYLIEALIMGIPIQLSDYTDKQISKTISELVKYHGLKYYDHEPMKLYVFNYIEHFFNIIRMNNIKVDNIDFRNLETKYFTKFSQVYNYYYVTDTRFCHNDLKYKNILIDDEEGVEEDITFINYDFSGPNSYLYELANLFCEFMGPDIDISKYPTLEKQKIIMDTYNQIENSIYSQSDKERYNKLSSDTKPKNSITDMDRIVYWTFFSHMFWGLWGILQNHTKKNSKFDYLSYSRKRLAFIGVN